MKSAFALAPIVFCIMMSAAIAGDPTITVSAKADIFGYGKMVPPGLGGGSGVIAPSVAIPAGTTAVTIPSATGSVTCAASCPYNGPEGNAGGGTDIQSLNGISGIVHNGRTLFLVGVFVGNGKPPARAPARRDETMSGRSATVSPKLYQSFYIGNGKLAGGTPVRFIVPAGAKRLVLGFEDAYGFHGETGFYDDNKGKLQVTVHFQ